MIVFGITGGIGSGKTAAAKFFEESGFRVIYSDELAKELMADNLSVKKKLVAAFGTSVYSNDGSLNKDFLSQLVFGDSTEHSERLNQLNSIVHPAVIETLIDRIEEMEKSGEKMVFVESALIFESSLEEGFDYIIVVNASKENCIARAASRPGMTASRAENRYKEQIPLEIKKSHADFVIENNGSLDELRRAVNFLIPILTILPQKENFISAKSE